MAKLLLFITETPTSNNVSHRAAVWDYPSTEMEKLRYKVFREFWEQGYYMTSGSKFGGDFLVYPGNAWVKVFESIPNFKSLRPYKISLKILNLAAYNGYI